MRNLSKLTLALATIALTSFSPTLDWQAGLGHSEPLRVTQGDRAEAKSSSGGRSRGGSFSGGGSSRSSGSSGSGGSNTRPQRSTPSSAPDRRPSYGYSSGYGYNSGYNSGYSNSSSSGAWLAFIVVGGVIAAIAYLIWKASKSSGTSEKTNNVVTITQLQVGLLAQEREIQDRLSELTLNAEMDTAEGRCEMLRECVLALLRSPENWSHVHSQTQIVKSREAAGTIFEQFSMTERSKVESETLVNVGGKVRHKAISAPDSDPGSYIIVTLLIGTEHDKPLFDKVQTTEALKTALQNLGAVSTEDLLILELLWNPQDSKESLTYDEMLAAYPEMGAIA